MTLRFQQLLISLLLAVISGACASGLDDAAGAAVLGPPMAEQSADLPAVKLLKDGTVHPGFQRAHEGNIKIARTGRTGLLFIGDSITEGWRRHQDIWNDAFARYQPDNFGLGWDRTQNVLWRLENGELDGMTPKLVVVLIGTNNLQSDPADAIARGIGRIVSDISGHAATTKTLLLGIFPRGQHADRNPARDKIAMVNALIAKLDDGKRVFYLDIGPRFLEPDGDISREMMPEYLHLTEKGYRIWADAITPVIDRLMK